MNTKRILTLAAFASVAAMQSADLTAGKRCCPKPCCPSIVTYPSTQAPSEAPSPADSAAPTDQPAQSDFDFDLASSFDAGADSQSIAPNMIGDGPGMGGMTGGAQVSGLAPLARFNVQKATENGSPYMQNRAYFSFNHFHNNIRSGIGGIQEHHTNRFTFGYERTILDGLASLGIRVPFGDTLATSQFGPSASEAVEFGNIWIAAKALLYQEGPTTISVGSGLNLPTADDAAFTGILVENNAVVWTPFIGGVYTPDSRTFVQGFIQFDVPLNGDQVIVGGVNMGEFTDQSRMHFDVATGYWVYRNPGSGGITGIAPIIETHYTTTLEDTETVGPVSNFTNRNDVLNGTFGVTVELNDTITTTTAVIVPYFQEEENRQFDTEISFQVNYFYGGQR